MTNEQMAKEIKTGNNDLIPELWEATRLYIFHALNHIVERNRANQERMVSAGVTKEDLDQEAFFILLEAVNAFDPAGGYSFISSLRFAAQTHFFALVGMRTAKGRNEPLSNADRLEQPIGTDEEDIGCLGDTIADKTATEAFDSVLDRDTSRRCGKVISDILDTLEPYERFVIVGIYFENKTLTQLAAERNVSIEAIRQKHMKALRKLRKGKYANQLRPYAAEIIDLYGYHSSVRSFRRTWSSSTEITAIKIMDHEKKYQ